MKAKAIAMFVAFAILSSTSFAAGAWLNTAALALTASFALLGLTYAIGLGFNMNDLKFLANEEAYQLIVTMIMIGALFGTQNYLDTLAQGMGLPAQPYSAAHPTTGHYFCPTPATPLGAPATTLQQGALNVLDKQLEDHNNLYCSLTEFSVGLGKESSKSYFCSLEGVGFNANPCGALRALATPVSTSFQALGMSIAELGSMRTLAQFSQQYAFTLLLPIGILLRTFKLTRGGGGLFIGLAIALYIFLPLSLAFMNVIIDPATGYNPSAVVINANDFSLPSPSCSEDHFGSWGGGVDYGNYNSAVTVFNGLKDKINTYVYYFLIRGTLTTIVAMLTVYASLRAISKAAGAEIDISALARIA